MNNRNNDTRLGFPSKIHQHLAHLKMAMYMATAAGSALSVATDGIDIKTFSGIHTALALCLSLNQLYHAYHNDFGAKDVNRLMQANNPVLLFANKAALHNSFKQTALNYSFLLLCFVFFTVEEVNRLLGFPNNRILEAITGAGMLLALVELYNFSISNNYGAEIHTPTVLRAGR